MVSIIATASLPTEYGQFQVVGFSSDEKGKEHLALVLGNIENQEEVLCRLHSECLTGDVFRSQRCDCAEQKDLALKKISADGQGVFIYHRQEGRGIGLANKIRAYKLQDEGLDTFAANQALGFADDERDFGVVAEILKLLKIKSIQLLTNNPDKILALEKAGVTVVARHPLIVPAGESNQRYLEEKKRKGHML